MILTITLPLADARVVLTTLRTTARHLGPTTVTGRELLRIAERVEEQIRAATEMNGKTADLTTKGPGV